MQKVVAITMVKNEMDIIESFVRHTLMFADSLLVADHHSTDDTVEILRLLQGEGLSLQVSTVTAEGYHQAEVMTELMYRAIQEHSADVVVPLDADEFLLMEGGSSGDLRQILQSLDLDKAYRVSWVDHEFVNTDDVLGRYALSCESRRATRPNFLPKVIVGRKTVIDHGLHLFQGNHLVAPFAEDGEGFATSFPHEELAGVYLAHFQWRSREQCASKAFCGWLTNVARFSKYSYYARYWRDSFRKYLSTGEIDLHRIENPVPAELSRYAGECELCYTSSAYSWIRNVLCLAESLASSYCQARVLSERPMVSILLLYAGNGEKLEASLSAAIRQSYPFCEFLLCSPEGDGSDEMDRLAKTYGKHGEISVLTGIDAGVMAERTRGKYVQWVREGDLLDREKVQKMVTVMETHSMVAVAGCLPNTTEDVYGSARQDFLPRHLAVLEQEEAIYLPGTDLRQFLLSEGYYVSYGLSGMLFRRNTMERLAWLRDCFCGPRPLMLTIWLKSITAKGQVALLAEPLVEARETTWSADDYILHEMEWFYLLESCMGKEILPKKDHEAAVRNFFRQREEMGEKLRHDATSELYRVYLSLA